MFFPCFCSGIFHFLFPFLYNAFFPNRLGKPVRGKEYQDIDHRLKQAYGGGITVLGIFDTDPVYLGTDNL